jgi:hypothetical protein
VPAEFCEPVSLCGPEGYVRERIDAFREAGVTMLNVTPRSPRSRRVDRQGQELALRGLDHTGARAAGRELEGEHSS